MAGPVLATRRTSNTRMDLQTSLGENARRTTQGSFGDPPIGFASGVDCFVLCGYWRQMGH